MNLYYKIFAGVVVIGCVSAAAIYLYLQQQKQKDDAAVQAITTNLLEAKYRDAIQETETLRANKQESDPLYAIDLEIASIASFNELALNRADAVSSEEWINVIHMAKKQLESTRDPYLQAGAVDLLLLVLHQTNDPVVAAEIFAGEPFNKLRGQDRSTSLKNLATYSIELYPTAPPYIMLARVRADAINYLLKPGSIVPIDNASSTGLISRANQIEENVKNAEMAAKTTKARDGRSPFSLLTYPWNTIWSAYALSQAARVDKKYWLETENMFKDAILYTETTVDKNGKPYPALLQLSAKARLYYARGLYDIFGDARASDITNTLDTLSAMIERQPELYTAQQRLFDLILKNRHRSEVTRHWYEEFAGLAKYSSSFASYLKSRGWDL